MHMQLIFGESGTDSTYSVILYTYWTFGNRGPFLVCLILFRTHLRLVQQHTLK